MNILLIVPEFPPHHIWWGGFVFESLAREYQKLWHSVLVISWDHTIRNIFKKIGVSEENNIDILRIPEFFSPLSLLNTVLPYPFWYNSKIKNIIKEFSPDFTHIHWYGLFMPAQAAKICYHLSLPYTFTIHGAPVSPEKMQNKLISFWYNFYHKYYGFPTLKNASRLTAVSWFARDFDIFQDYKKDIEIVWNWLALSDYKKPEYDIFTQLHIRSSKNTKIIFSLGRIEWIKWFEKIIKLIPEMISKTWQDIQYVIAGRDNWEKNNLIQLTKELNIQDKVHFIWFIDGRDKMSALFSSDIIAIPSESESYGLVWLEARVAKKPILTTFAWWLKDALKWYDWAFTLQDYQKAIQYVSNKEWSLDEFTWETISNKYLKI